MPDHIKKLAKICGMFGSDHAGERASAAAQADALRKKIGKTWEQLLSGPSKEREFEGVFDPRSMSPGHLGGAFENILTEWEAAFLKSLAGRRGLSPKQREIFERIREKCAAWWEGQEARRHAA